MTVSVYPDLATSSARQELIKNGQSGNKATSMESLVGNTPLVHFPLLTAHLPPTVRVFAKAEWANPGGSVKDRPALNIVLEAEKAGDLRPGVTLLDSSSGNMGIAYAMICRARGHRIKLVLPENVSPERLATLRAYGVEVELSDPLEGSDGAIRLVQELYEAAPDKYFFADQYSNENNWRAHYKTTGVEIWEQTGKQVTHFIAGLGTSGTLMGVGRRLRELNPDVTLLAVQPDSPFHGLEGLKHMETAIKPAIYNEALHNGLLHVRTEDAHAMCRRIAREEGILIGVSAGAAMHAVLTYAENLANEDKSGVIVTMLPDNASKYLSEPFWAKED